MIKVTLPLTVIAAGALVVGITACGSTKVAHGTGLPSSPTSSASATADVASAATPDSAGNHAVQGADSNDNPYGDFRVTLKRPPHLEQIDFDGSPYQPENPLQSDGTCLGGECDPPGYEFIHFTLTFTNPGSNREAFGTVGFTPAIKPMAYLAAPSIDQGMTPAGAFGGPTNGLEPVTRDNVVAYWEANRDGPGDLFQFPEPFAQSHFLFNVNPSAKYDSVASAIPNVLNPGQSVDVEYVSDAVAATSPLDALTVWAGYNPQQIASS